MRQIVLNAINENDLRQIIKEVFSETIQNKSSEKQHKSESKYLSRFEVVELLKISLPTLNNWTKQGVLQSYRIGNRVLYKQDEVELAVKATRNLKYKRG